MGQHMSCVLPFRRGPLGDAIKGSQCRLTLTLVITPFEEIAEGGAFCRDLVTGDRVRLIDPDSPAIAFCGSQTQVGIFRTGPGANLSEANTETANRIKSMPTDGHIVTPNVAHPGSTRSEEHTSELQSLR